MRKWLFILLFLILPVLSYASMINEWWLWEEEEVRPRPAKIEEAVQPGTIWKDPYLGMEFVWVPGGCYEMGCTSRSWFSHCEDDEYPVHTVCVNGFWMGRYEVTAKQWKSFVRETGYEGGSNYWGCDGMAEPKGSLWYFDHPVVCVSWHDAKAFAKWLSKKTGYKFRLPTEAEWEYACRSGGKKVKCGTSTGDLSHDLANYWEKGGRDKWYSTAPVGSFPPNELGIYDMSGNVWEWCEDVYSSDAYKHHNRKSPIYTGRGSYRVIRGGSWDNKPRRLRCADRWGRLHSIGFFNVGFRLLLQK